MHTADAYAGCPLCAHKLLCKGAVVFGKGCQKHLGSLRPLIAYPAQGILCIKFSVKGGRGYAQLHISLPLSLQFKLVQRKRKAGRKLAHEIIHLGSAVCLYFRLDGGCRMREFIIAAAQLLNSFEIGADFIGVFDDSALRRIALHHKSFIIAS